MINRIFKNKSFLDISKAKTVSQSVVFVDAKYKGLIPTGSQQLQINTSDNPFRNLANIIVLGNIMGNESGFEVPRADQNPLTPQSFTFGDIIFTYEIFPPKFIIKQNFDAKNTEVSDKKIKDISKKASTIGKINQSLSAIGFNYEMIIDNKDDEIKLKEKVCNPRITNDFKDVNIKLTYVEEEMTLNLSIADATYNGQKSIFIGANFHNDISSKNRFDNIIEKDFKRIIDRKLKA
jgi:hypothetical protein